jgi:DNA polymerase-1
MDAKVGAHIVDSELYRDCTLEDLISQFAPTSENHKGAVSTAEKEDMLALLKTDREKFIKYASLDPVFTLKVSLELRKKLLEDKQSLNYFVNFAQPIETEFLFEMERNGVLVDKDKIPELKAKLKKEIADKELQFKRLCPLKVRQRHGDNFKLTRTVILQEALFEWRDTKLKKNQTKAEHHNYGFNLEPIVMNKKSGTPSTDKKAVMGAILDGQYPKKVKELVQTHRDWSERDKLLNNFIKNIEKYLDENDRLHPSFSITFTTSGRTGCRSPNLQNQPKRGPLAKMIRELYIAPKGRKLIERDYKASELRWVAHITDDKEFKRIFKAGKDPHIIRGLKIRGLPEDYEFKSKDELKETKQNAKAVNFGLIYLMTPNGLKRYSKQGYGVEISDKQAHINHRKFMTDHHPIPKWHDRCKSLLQKQGYLRTIFGRKRVLQNVFSTDDWKRMAAERTGINTLIQGPSSDATLLAGYTFIKDPRVKKDECQIVLFIHDALIPEIIDEKVDYYQKLLKEHMENIPTEKFGFKLSVPLETEGEVGQRLSEMQPIEE